MDRHGIKLQQANMPGMGPPCLKSAPLAASQQICFTFGTRPCVLEAAGYWTAIGAGIRSGQLVIS